MPAPRHRRPVRAAKKSPMVPLAIGGGVVVLIVVVVIVMTRGGDDSKAKPGETTAAATTSTTTPAQPSPLAATPPANASPVAEVAVPSKPKLDVAAVTARLAEANSAADAIGLGDEALAETKDLALAESCWQKALELEPGNGDAKNKLGFRPIDADAEFAGLEEIHGSAQTYMIREFLLMKGKEMSRAQREKEVVRWKEKRKVIQARMAEAADDPFLEKIDRTRNTLLNQPFFDKLLFEVIETTRPYALFVELKGESVTERDERREQVENAYQPYLEAYDRTIHRYLVKLSPAPPKNDPTFILFILLDRASYDRFFLEFEQQPPSPGLRAHYNWKEKWAFTYSPEVKNPKDPDFGEGTQAMLHELTHNWVDRLATSDGPDVPENRRHYDSNLVQTHWFNEGIAEFMSCHFLGDDGVVRFQPWKSLRISKSGERPAGVRIPFQVGFKIGRHQGLEAEAWRVARAQTAIEPARAAAICLPGFYADMSLFIFWLNYADGRKYKRKFEEYVRKELSGSGGSEVAEKLFHEIFALPDLEKTIDDFQQAVLTGKVSFTDGELTIEK